MVFLTAGFAVTRWLSLICKVAFWDGYTERGIIGLVLCLAKTTSEWKRAWFTDSQADLGAIIEGLIDDGIIG